MGWNFRRSVKILPGVRLNLGKKSWGVSVGDKYGGISYNSKRGVTARTSIPGTGISYTEKLSGGGKGQSPGRTPPQGQPPRNNHTGLWVLGVLLALAGFVTLPDSAVCGLLYILAGVATAPIPAVQDRLHALGVRGWVKVVAVLALMVAGSAFLQAGTESPPPDAPEAVEAQADVVNAFISKYNQENETGIDNVSEIDIHDKKGSRYRVEFRLSAYKNAVAKRGYIGDIGIDMVHFGFWMDDFRVYSDLIGDMETAYQIFRALALAMDASIPEEDFQKVHDSLARTGEESGAKLGGNVTGVISELRINQNSFWGIMLTGSTDFK